MKKIYLIDDNEYDQRALLGATAIDEGVYDDVLVHIERLSPHDDMHSIISEAACLMIHKTIKDWIDGAYVDGGLRALSKLKKEMKVATNEIPVVYFSGNDQTTEYSDNNPNVIFGISKSVFYERLIPFLEKYRQKGTINLDEIAFGANYKSQKARDLASSILSALVSHQNEEKVCYTWFEGDSRNALRDIVKLSQPEIGTTFDEVMNDLIKSDITVCTFKNRINRILRSFNQNGENIYPWK